MKPTRCPCGSIAAHRCNACGRPVCRWHFALQPIGAPRGVSLVPVCLPLCNSAWWDAPTESRRASA
jgi:hypothetical protein